MHENSPGAVSSGEAPQGGGEPDERRKLSVIKRLQAQGATPEQIAEHLDKLDKEQAQETYEKGALKRGVQIFRSLDRPKILGPNGEPL